MTIYEGMQFQYEGRGTVYTISEVGEREAKIIWPDENYLEYPVKDCIKHIFETKKWILIKPKRKMFNENS
jgi:hypothetical protein